jgi:hypothetical protein
MKKCTKCQLTKNKSEFHNRTDSKDGLSSWCKSCAIIKAKESYKNNIHNRKEAAQISSKIYRTKLLDILNKIKSQNKCCVCNESTPVCLDFHHLDAKSKSNEVSTLARKKSIQIMFNEIKKCIVVCSNCHRKIHYKLIDVSNQSLCQVDIKDYI